MIGPIHGGVWYLATILHHPSTVLALGTVVKIPMAFLHDHGRWRLMAHWLTLIVAFLFILEGGSAIFFHTMKSHYMFYELENFTISPKQIREQNSIFDEELGW